ncbi:MAG TPA: hypothetical protein VFH41_09405 [Bradyrhizobium sp.]|nr:hypothetical protein [Bradyrhizobium sp.]
MVGFPLLLIPLAIYNIVVFLMPGVSFAEPLVKVPLMSGAEWPVNLSDILLALGIFLLLLEIIKGARPGAKYFTDHLLSLVVFTAAAAEFLLWPRFGTSTYLLLTMLALVDFLSGIALRTRRWVPFVAAAPSEPATRNPAAGVAPAASLATPSAVEDVSPDHPELEIAHSDGVPRTSSGVGSPVGPPDNGSATPPDAPRR